MSLILVASMLAFSGCVTTQQYEALQTQLDEAESENATLVWPVKMPKCPAENWRVKWRG